MASRNSKVMPNKAYWIAIIFLSILAVFTTITMKYGFTLLPYPVIIFFFGRGKQKQEEGLKTH